MSIINPCKEAYGVTCYKLEYRSGGGTMCEELK